MKLKLFLYFILTSILILVSVPFIQSDGWAEYIKAVGLAFAIVLIGVAVMFFLDLKEMGKEWEDYE